MEPYNKLIQLLISVTNEVSKGNYKHVEKLFELTNSQQYPSEISTLAEAFGLMIVQLEARQHKLEDLIDDLQKTNANLKSISNQLFNANIGMLETLGSVIAKRDSDTSSHNYRVTIYSINIAQALNLDDNSIRGLIKGAFLHDVGKIAISDSILLKPDKLTEYEFEIMKTHVNHGSDIVSNYAWLHDALDVVQYHHERFNGSGYQKGLKGTEIPFNARIFSIADVFDALTSVRPYKKAFSLDKSLYIMQKGSSTFFDPDIIQVFLTIAQDVYKQVFSEDTDNLKIQLNSYLNRYFSPETIMNL
ncbi:MAG: HD-GYP domain-containing protein [Thermodesulfovibrionales bacterium]|nr:HD-GYP domain-containing protein [Thermodesulfovibrionales bacterium]